MITALENREARLKSLQAGVEEFLVKPVDRSELCVRVRNMLRLKEHQNFLSDHNRLLEQQVAERTSKLEAAMLGTVRAVSSMLDMRDPYTAGHERRVGALAKAIGAELGLSTERCAGLEVMGLVHDIGKIAVPAELLVKPGRLTSLQFALIQSHAQAGYDVLQGVEFPWPLALTILQHHERLDGSGYPQCLKGEQIILEARIIAVADVVEAMSSHRPYRMALGIEMALQEIESNSGSGFDADVVQACLRLFREKAYQFPEPSAPAAEVDRSA